MAVRSRADAVKVFLAGAEAARDGDDPVDCPHPPDSVETRLWMRGFAKVAAVLAGRGEGREGKAGRVWRESMVHRDRLGRFARVGAAVALGSGDTGQVTASHPDGTVSVRRDGDGGTVQVPAKTVQVTDGGGQPPDGAGAPPAAPGTATFPGIATEGRPNARGTAEDPIDVGADLDEAVRLLGEGKHIRLNQPNQAATLLSKVAAVVQDAKSKGKGAPTYDLCKVSVPGTNLFCRESKGIPRAQMPQLSGEPTPGSPAAALVDERGKADIGPAFKDALAAGGIKVTPKKAVPASHLRVSQRDLNGVAVAGMYTAMKNGNIAERPIFVTRDGYILDGHHRWASKIALDVEGNKPGTVTMPVEEVDLDIGAAIDFANQFTAQMGIQSRGTENAPLTDEEYQAHTERIERLIGDALKAGQSTDVVHTVDGNGQVWKPERAKQHKAIVDELYGRAANAPNDGKAVIAGGLGGSGKSTVLGKYAGIDSSQYVTINPDDVKEMMAERDMIPNVEGLSAMESSAIIHEESSHIAQMLAQRAYADRKNIIFDITMASLGSTQRRITELQANGYGSLEAVFVDIPVETSVTRALARHRRGLEDFRRGKGLGGRYVPPAIIRKNAVAGSSSANRVVFDTLRSSFTTWSVWDNSAMGTPPRQVASGGRP